MIDVWALPKEEERGGCGGYGQRILRSIVAFESEEIAEPANHSIFIWEVPTQYLETSANDKYTRVWRREISKEGVIATERG